MTITPDISVAIAFVIFVVLVAWKGTKKLTAGLDQRADAIRKQLDETQNLREEAQAALASYQRQQRSALAEAEHVRIAPLHWLLMARQPPHSRKQGRGRRWPL